MNKQIRRARKLLEAELFKVRSAAKQMEVILDELQDIGIVSQELRRDLKFLGNPLSMYDGVKRLGHEGIPDELSYRPSTPEHEAAAWKDAEHRLAKVKLDECGRPYGKFNKFVCHCNRYQNEVSASLDTSNACDHCTMRLLENFKQLTTIPVNKNITMDEGNVKCVRRVMDGKTENTRDFTKQKR